ncbi:MAG: phosphoribosylanthranilate isomerase [Lachnospiraceae bacterium]|nr:phosphoribosylanthranilate isomerase [Lachnospiraceae bacterium]
MTKIKICGLTRPEDIEAVNRLKPDYIGFVFAKSRRQVGEEQAAYLKNLLHPNICPVGVFVDEDEERICRLVERHTIRIVQLHGHETPQQVNALRSRLNCPIIKAVRMESGHSLELWQESDVDFLLLDAGAGGTGNAFDHDLILRAGQITKLWFLAGGMNPDNAADAIQRFAPFGIDVSSGVETGGKKDPQKIEKMIRNVRGAQKEK